MPIVTYLGPFHQKRMPDTGGDFTRGVPTTVSQPWLDQYRRLLPPTHYRLEGDNPPTADDGDGIPDKKWRVADIRAWLDGYGMNPKGYATKSGLLKLVNDALTPEKAEDVIAEIEEQAEAVLATPVEEVVADNTPSETQITGE